MKKIAILTHSIANNFGANLQALSTASYLQNNGYYPVFLQWGSYLTSNTPTEQEAVHRLFLEKNGFEMSPPLQTDDDFASFIRNEQIKRIIVGSDCVLTYERNRFPFRLTKKGIVRVQRSIDYDFPNPFWLPFLSDIKDVRTVLMSASCGGASTMKITEHRIKESMISLLNRFDYISVRDTFTARFVKKMQPSRHDIHITPDPVFGFNRNVHNIPSEDEIRKKFNLREQYILISFYYSFWPNQKWADSLMKEAHAHRLQCVSILMPQGGRKSYFDLNLDLPLDPLDWYALIKYSKGYVGNNMHPIIVALHNIVPFFSFNIHGRSFLYGRIQLIRTSKEYDLLRRFGLHKYVIPQPFLPLVKPQIIISRLVSFERDKFLNASKCLQEEYEAMMTEVLNVLV